MKAFFTPSHSSASGKSIMPVQKCRLLWAVVRLSGACRMAKRPHAATVGLWIETRMTAVSIDFHAIISFFRG
jgi:hypothetical protein